MQKKKRGISLIVLVITIIVMIILAAAVIISLNNNGIIERASNAVIEHNLDEVNHIAQVAWSEAYLNKAKTQEEFETVVFQALDNNNIDRTKYDITVTTGGVTVALKEEEEEPVISTFEFTIDTETYTAEEGMTWAEWCESDYNTDGYVNDSNFIILNNSYSKRVDVDPDDTIQSQTYLLEKYVG